MLEVQAKFLLLAARLSHPREAHDPDHRPPAPRAREAEFVRLKAPQPQQIYAG